MSTAASSQLIGQIEKLLKVTVDNGATELRMSGGGSPMLRINDKLTPLKTRAISPEEVEGMAEAIMPSGGSASAFDYESSVGNFACGLHDVQGTKVLVLKHAPRAAAPAADDYGGGNMPLELDIQEEEKPTAAPVNGGSGETFAMPKAAEGTILIDKLLTAADLVDWVARD